MNITKFALFAALSCCSVSAMAQWQWIDGQGRKVFSDRAPPAEIPAKNVLRSPGGASLSKATAVPDAVPAPATLAKPAADKGVDKGLEEQKRKQEEQEAAKKPSHTHAGIKSLRRETRPLIAGHAENISGFDPLRHPFTAYHCIAGHLTPRNPVT